MRLSLPLRHIAPGPSPPTPTVPQVLSYLGQKLDVPLKLDDQVESITFLIKTYAAKMVSAEKAKYNNRFLAPRRLPKEWEKPFQMPLFAYQNPDVTMQFVDRASVHPDRQRELSLSKDEVSLEAVDRGGLTSATVEEQRLQEEALVNQEEFADVYFIGNPTPLRLNITELNADQTISLLTSVVPPPSTSIELLSSAEGSENIATTSPSEPSPSIPLGQGGDLWEHVWKSRDLGSDQTLYVWRQGQRERLKSRSELLAEGKQVRGPGLPDAKRKWLDGKCMLQQRGRGLAAEGGEEEAASASA